jgi:hypothetical protein
MTKISRYNFTYAPDFAYFPTKQAGHFHICFSGLAFLFQLDDIPEQIDIVVSPKKMKESYFVIRASLSLFQMAKLQNLLLDLVLMMNSINLYLDNFTLGLKHE